MRDAKSLRLIPTHNTNPSTLSPRLKSRCPCPGLLFGQSHSAMEAPTCSHGSQALSPLSMRLSMRSCFRLDALPGSEFREPLYSMLFFERVSSTASPKAHWKTSRLVAPGFGILQIVVLHKKHCVGLMGRSLQVVTGPRLHGGVHHLQHPAGQPCSQDPQLSFIQMLQLVSQAVLAL